MRYHTTSISRRMVMVKVKTKAVADKLLPPARGPSPPSHSSGEKHPHAISDGTARQSAQILQIEPAWRNWKIIVPMFALVGGLIVYTNFLGKNNSAAEPHSIAAHHTSPTPPPVINIRPMGYHSPASQRTVAVRQPAAGQSVTQAVTRAEIERDAIKTTRSTPSGPAYRSVSSDELFTALDNGRKLQLPEDVSGQCAIGNGGMKDFSRCLAQAGARINH